MHLLFIYPHPYYFTNPTLAYLLGELKKREEVTVTLLIPEQKEILPSEYKGFFYKKFNFSVTWPKKFWKWIPILIEYASLIIYCQTNKISKIIAIDPDGIIVGGRLKKSLNNIELHYMSFEILFNRELVGLKYFGEIKNKEIYYSRLVNTLIVQDEVRAKLLFLENKIESDRVNVFYIPVAPIINQTSKSVTTEYRSKLGIVEDEIVLLHSGSVAKWSGAELLINALKKGLPNKYKLLIHSKHKLSATNELHAELIRLQKEGYPLILHDDSFPDYDDYLNFMKCANYGLAFYISDKSSPYTGRNIEEIGLASGKFASYISQGIPTIVTYAKIYQELNNKYNFGLLINSVEEFCKVLDSSQTFVFNNKMIFSLYKNELDPEKFGKHYLDYLMRPIELITEKQKNV
ncbi:hypothetical protein ACS5NO_03660 [Larkinella sp. GY13]|uniref:hypothetical protein n=1 Tax=Larkinella sp. GY13 TaxID=3453720 RepID=UPI003EEA7521